MLRYISCANPLLRSRSSNSALQCGIKQSVAERLGLPEKPKRPSSPFIKFMAQVRPEITSKNSGTSPADIARIGGEMWKKSNEATKKQFQDLYAKEKEQYDVLIAKYNASLTPQQKEEIADALEELKDQKEKREVRLSNARKNKELGKPTKPLSSFLLFAKAEYHQRGDTGIGAFQTVLSKKWKSLSEEQKQKYTNEAASAKESYEKSLEAWEKKMIKLGHLDVVRNKTLEEVSGKKGSKSH